MEKLIKLKTDIKVSQSLPYLRKIAKYDGLHLSIEKDFTMAWGKFKMLLIICEQNNLEYWVNKDFREAIYIYERSLDFSLVNEQYDMTQYLN